ncbi:hypothetical protein HY642_07060 [Candidatus Woesearchaeota archaeon]|nr:hypothetical protein [Candidatus Woesearchaeota archaeon]
MSLATAVLLLCVCLLVLTGCAQPPAAMNATFPQTPLSPIAPANVTLPPAAVQAVSEEFTANLSSATSQPSPSNRCRQLTPSSARIQCLTHEAARTGNTSLCDEIPQDSRFNCYILVAVTQRDTSVCDSLQNRSYCYSSVAYFSNDSSICEKLTGSEGEHCGRLLLLFINTTPERFVWFEGPGFAIQYPPSWSIDDVSEPFQRIVVFTSPLHDPADKYRESVSIIVGDLSGEPKTLEEFTYQRLDELSITYPEMQIIVSEPVQLSGHPAQAYVVAAPVRRGVRKMFTAWTVVDKVTAYIFTYTANEATYNEWATNASRMLNTFTITGALTPQAQTNS